MTMGRMRFGRARLLLSGILIAFLPAMGAGQAFQTTNQKGSGAPPAFADLPATDLFKGKPVPVKLLTPEARKYRTMLRDGAKDGPNFAGHYTVAQWGAGAGCVQFAIIDARTGDVYMPPFYVCIAAPPDKPMDQIPEPLQFKPDSKLLIVTGARNEKGSGVYYYKWEKNRLALITSMPLPKS